MQSIKSILWSGVSVLCLIAGPVGWFILLSFVIFKYKAYMNELAAQQAIEDAETTEELKTSLQ